MNVHFTASAESLDEDIHVYRKIMSLVRENNHTIVRDWVESHLEFVNGGGKSAAMDWADIFKENMDNIAYADAIIIEASIMNFPSGYTAALAVGAKKPVLMLSRHDNFYGFPMGIESELVKLAVYDQDNLSDLVSGFLSHYDIKQKDMRFNFFIDREIHNYLLWAAHKTGKNKSEIIRSMIKDRIHEMDGNR